LNLNTKEKSKSAGNKVIASEVVGVGVCVACYKRGLKNRGGGGVVVVKLDVCSRTVIAGRAKVSINEAISLSTRDGFSRFRSLLVKSKETDELCTGSSSFCVSRTRVRIT
ncbi:hypothetical protein Tco_0507351, partial [Tanacetum coccineum]